MGAAMPRARRGAPSHAPAAFLQRSPPRAPLSNPLVGVTFSVFVHRGSRGVTGVHGFSTPRLGPLLLVGFSSMHHATVDGAMLFQYRGEKQFEFQVVHIFLLLVSTGSANRLSSERARSCALAPGQLCTIALSQSRG